MRILVAGEVDSSRRMLSHTVERLGHELLVASDGHEAWDVFAESAGVDVVISDWQMPGMDGPDLCRKVRESSRSETVFIFLTAFDGEDHSQKSLEAGADGYLSKPLDEELLRSKLEEIEQGLATPANGARSSHETRESSQPPAADSGRGSYGRARGRSGRLWDILVTQGKLTEEQLESAAEAQRGSSRELGEVLVAMGVIGKEDIARANAERLRLEYVELSEKDVDRAALELFPEKMLRRHGALPLRVEDGKLVIAVSDPTNIHALDDLKMISGHPLSVVVATEDDIGKVQTRFFAAGESLTGILQDAAGDEEEESEDLDIGAEATPDERPVIRLVSSILQQAVSDRASDIHVEPRSGEVAVRLRVDGVLREIMSIPPRLQSGVIARLKIIGNLDIAERRIPQDGRFSVRLASKKVDFRVASLPTVHGEKVVLRLMDTASVEADLRKLGFAHETFAAYEDIFQRPYGAILVTGPTGSGKSTTLYATLKELNSPEKNIITVEDPVELRVQGVNQVQVNPRAGLTFASGLRSILRSDPDIVMIGEIRDHDTAKISVEAALTGHLVLATLHTNNAPGALTRLTEMGVEPFLTSSAVDCVIAQRLARRLCSRCKQPTEVEEGVLEEMGFPFERLESQPRLYKAVGCERCGGTGYRGRVGIYELMVVTEEIREMILRRVSTAEISRSAERAGMMRLREDGLLKAARGMTTIEEVLRTVL